MRVLREHNVRAVLLLPHLIHQPVDICRAKSFKAKATVAWNRYVPKPAPDG
jgi:hypothetical protein